MKKYFFFTWMTLASGYFIWDYNFNHTPVSADLSIDEKVLIQKAAQTVEEKQMVNKVEIVEENAERAPAAVNEDQELKEMLSDEDYMKTFEEQTPEERTKTIAHLQKDIAYREGIIFSLKSSGEEEGIYKLEEVLRNKKAQLEYYQFNSSQLDQDFQQ